MSARRNKLVAIAAEALGKEVLTHDEIEAYFTGLRDGNNQLVKEKLEELEEEPEELEEEPEELEEEPEELEEEVVSDEDERLRLDLEELTVDVLRDKLKERGLKVSGRKNKLIDRLIRGEDEDDEE